MDEEKSTLDLAVKKKRRRQRGAEVKRQWFCQWEGCQKGYKFRRSLVQHVRLKHPEEAHRVILRGRRLGGEEGEVEDDDEEECEEEGVGGLEGEEEDQKSGSQVDREAATGAPPPPLHPAPAPRGTPTEVFGVRYASNYLLPFPLVPPPYDSDSEEAPRLMRLTQAEEDADWEL